jgi:NhaP-type Na+/H+ or K+/H+ antiporter
METVHVSFTIAIALAAGVLAQSVAKHLHLPGIVLLLAFGVGLGSDGLGWVHPQSLGTGLLGIVDFAVAIILFEGGLNLEITRLRRQEQSLRRLITLGALITLGGAALAVRLLLDWSWSLSLLFGSLVVVTGPTVVAPLLRDMRLRSNLKSLLEGEGVLIDPIGAILAILVLNLTIGAQSGLVATEAMDFAFRLGFGLLMGGIGGYVLGSILRVRSLVPHGFENIFMLAAIFLLFQGADQVISQSGILAVTVAGIVVGNMRTPVDRDLREFKDQLTILLVGMLFILLAADVRFEEMRSLGWGGLAVLAALIFIIRPINVWLSTMGSSLSWKERVFIAWIAPRGIVAAAIASLMAGMLDARDLTGGAELRALVFLTIAGTVGLAGLTGKPLASLLSLRLPNRDRVAILGAEGLGIVLANVLREQGLNVVFLDSDPKLCHQAEKAGFPVVFGDALQERTLIRGRIELVGTVIGLTPNEHLNHLFVDQARELFGVPQGYVALESFEGEKVPEHIQRLEEHVLWEGPHDVERWSVRLRHKDVVVEQLMYHPPPKPDTDSDAEDKTSEKPSPTPKNGELFVILAIQREKSIVPMYTTYKLREEDVAFVAIYRPEREQAIAQLQVMGWQLLPQETVEALNPDAASPEKSDRDSQPAKVETGKILPT